MTTGNNFVRDIGAQSLQHAQAVQFGKLQIEKDDLWHLRGIPAGKYTFTEQKIESLQTVMYNDYIVHNLVLL